MVDENGQKVQGSKVLKASYKSTLLGATQAPAQNTFMVDEFALIKGDVVMKVIKAISSITFFDWVKGYIERRMARTVIVKMLGGRIGFNAFLNKISLLWNPRYPIQLMDLENDFS
ncbi:hypothetical protein PVK06_001587 [Gossypium arboreum]|uniref:Uncharacterized protein n=1 Tax=Gossypium arboreum TaxID=29729 RepID=A0ABR0R2G5_GOSAR|nr:hypothetical protein PVK06_001587 [Gossypium arboreum]